MMCGMLRVILTSKAPKQGWLHCLHRQKTNVQVIKAPHILPALL